MSSWTFYERVSRTFRDHPSLSRLLVVFTVRYCCATSVISSVFFSSFLIDPILFFVFSSFVDFGWICFQIVVGISEFLQLSIYFRLVGFVVTPMLLNSEKLFMPTCLCYCK